MTYPQRIRLLLNVIVAAFALVTLRLAVVQIARAQELRRKAADRIQRTVTLPTTRGSILDRNAVVLASSNATRFAIGLRIDRLDDLDEARRQAFLRDVARTYETDLPELEETIRTIRRRIAPSSRREPQVILRGVLFPQAMAVELEPERFPALVVLPDTARRNPQGELASHVLGRVVSPIWKENWQKYRQKYPDQPRKRYRMNDTFGASGLELAFEDELRGLRGRRTQVIDSRGRVQLVLSETLPEFGMDLTTTIDCQVQRAAEMAFAQRGARGAAVVIDVRTGGLLCLASYPTFDLHAQKVDPEGQPFVRRATSQWYPPGSTYKIFVAAAGLQTGRLAPGTFLTCNGRYEVGDTSFTCMGHHGSLNLEYALARSCNIYFYQAAEIITPAAVEHWTRAFGFGEPTGVEVGEKAGIAFGPGWKRGSWYPGDTANLAIGQGATLVTPLQMARAVAAIANGGTVLRPHLKLAPAPAANYVLRKLDLSETTLLNLHAGMRSVVKFGTAKAAFAGFNVDLAAKTGTAQTGGATNHAWFAGFAPADTPKLAFAVVVEDIPAGEHDLNPACLIARDLLAVLRDLGYLQGDPRP